jgi:cytochrome c-type biogenesis protein CcmH
VRALATALVLLLLAPASALADLCPKTSTSDVADEVMCLQCGVPLNVAEDAPSAKRERAFIQQLVDRCRTKEQIKTALVAEFGGNVLADPKSSSTWLVPALGFAAAVLALGAGAWRWRRQRGGRAKPETPAAAAAPVPAPTADSARLDADMDRYRL